MATVTMDLTEVEALKSSVETWKQTAAKEVEKLQELKSEMVAVKADKRVMKITKKTISNYGICKEELTHLIQNFLNHTGRPRYSEIGHSYSEHIANEIYARLTNRNLYIKDTGDDQVEFMNFDDVKTQLKEIAEQQVSDELMALKLDKKNSKSEIERIKAENYKKLEDYCAEFVAEKEKYQKIINKKDEEYQDLLLDKDTRTTELKLREEIEELKAQLNQPLLKRIFTPRYDKQQRIN